ncbi:MAG: type II toxin-antitoxin system RelE/ParE family toxin [Candidatus Methylumidiphilus sp.]
MNEPKLDKPLFWIGSSWSDLKDCPDEVQDFIGYALHWAQRGGKSPDAKPLQGFGGAGVLEILDDFDGNTYRAMYTVRFAGAVYALHVFQKKSRKGIATPKQDIELVKARLKRAENHYAAWVADTQGRTP